MNKTTLITLFSLTVLPAWIATGAKAEPAAVVPGPEQIGLEISTSASATGGVRLKALGLEYPEMRSYDAALAVKFTRPLFGAGDLGIGLNVQRTTFRMDQGVWRLPMPDRFQNTNLELSYQARINDSWNGLVSVGTGWRIAGATSLGGKGFGTVLTAMGFYSASPTLKFAVGAMVDTLAEGSSRFVPAVGVEWEFAPKWRLALGVPRTGVFYAFSESLELGAVAEATWSTYYVDKNARVAPFAGQVLSGTKVEYTEARAGLQANWRLTSQSSFSLTVGAVGYRGIEYPQRHLKLKSSGVDGGYASAGLSFQF